MGKPPAASRNMRKAQGSGSPISRTKLPPEAQARGTSQTEVETTIPDQNVHALELNLPVLGDIISVSREADVPKPLNWISHAGDSALTAIDVFDQDQGQMSHSINHQFGHFGSTDQGLFYDDNCVRSIGTPFHHVGHSDHRASADAFFLPIIKPEPSNPLCDCTSLVSSTLQNLDVDCNVWDVMSPINMAHRTLTIDRVLINNKTAIENVYRFLACPCSLDLGFSLAVTLICYHIIERYKAIAGATPTTHSTSSRPASATAMLLTTRITVGEYLVDAEDEYRMGIQLVVNQLRKMRGLVEKYGERYCFGLDGNKERHEGIFSALEMFLKSKLEETVTYMVHALQN
ncbi:hypothetical protein MMC07_007148 [Pseudocyphellaria aurata]|nr:hypothetical protein [Pseudocyphellaria aurata]